MKAILRQFYEVYRKKNYIYYRKAQYITSLLVLLIIFINVTAIFDMLTKSQRLDQVSFLVYNLFFILLMILLKNGYFKLSNRIYQLLTIIHICILYYRQDYFQLVPMLFLFSFTIAIIYVVKREFIYSLIFYNLVYIYMLSQTFFHYLDNKISYEIFISIVYSYFIFLLYSIILNTLATILKNEILKTERLELYAYTDQLTNVYNRRKFDELTDEIIGKGKTFTMMIIDIDHFKSVNDNFGHSKGDCVLINFAKTIEKQLDYDQYLFRWGGEEFIIILENCNKHKAYRIGQRLAKRIRKHDFKLGYSLTFSLGLAQFNKGMKLDRVIEEADLALYRAKKGGRNRIVIA